MRPARPLRRLAAALSACATLVLCAALSGHTAAADPPRTLAALLPQGAAAFVELDDLRALTRRWNGSKLHKQFDRSRAGKEMEKSRLYLRLAQNVAQLEEVSGVGLSLERIAQLGGHRTVVALYDVPETRFLFLTELTSDEAKRSNLFGQKGRLQSRELRGVKYLFKEPARGRPALAVAQIGGWLLAGTDVDAFRGALPLVARAAGATVAPGKDATPLADQTMMRMLAIAPREAPVRVWVNQGKVSGTHYFDDYWIFGKESGEGIDQALITFAPGDVASTETRIYAYKAGAGPNVAEDKSAEVGHADVAARAAVLPAAPPFAGAWPVDETGAAQAVVELLPRGGPHEEADNDPAPLAQALAPAGPRRALEALSPTHPKGGFAEHHAAIAIGLATPGALDGKKLEAALAKVLAPRVGGGDAAGLSFSDDGDVRALKLPLVSEWSLAWRRTDGGLVIATDPAACRALVSALAAKPTAALLAASAPRLYRLDVDRAAAAWKDVAKTLAARGNWSDSGDAELFEKSVGGLFDLDRDLKKVVAFGYSRDATTYVEEVQYRDK